MLLCTANMCRSPIAEVLLRQKLNQRPDANEWKVESAGTWTVDGKPAAAITQHVMRQYYGIDLSGHRTQTVTRELLKTFDLILVMERGQKEALSVEFPDLSSRVYLLSEMVGKTNNVVDPILGTLEDCRQTAQEIDDLLSKGLERIVDLAKGIKSEERG